MRHRRKQESTAKEGAAVSSAGALGLVSHQHQTSRLIPAALSALSPQPARWLVPLRGPAQGRAAGLGAPEVWREACRAVHHLLLSRANRELAANFICHHFLSLFR